MPVPRPIPTPLPWPALVEPLLSRVSLLGWVFVVPGTRLFLGLARSSKRKALALALPWQEISAAWPCLTSFKSGAIALALGFIDGVKLFESLDALVLTTIAGGGSSEAKAHPPGTAPLDMRAFSAKPGRRPSNTKANALWHAATLGLGAYRLGGLLDKPRRVDLDGAKQIPLVPGYEEPLREEPSLFPGTRFDRLREGCPPGPRGIVRSRRLFRGRLLLSPFLAGF